MSSIIKKLKQSLSTQIFVGLILGILTGLFLGEMASWLNFLGDIFIRLSQMPVIPYIIVSLISSLGRLNYTQAKSIFLKGGIVIVVFWVIIIIVIALFPLGFPSWKSSAFFSTSLLKEVESLSLIELFFTYNPFHSMANSIMPSLVVFCIAMGLGLMTGKDKQDLLKGLDIITDALLKIIQFVAKLTPFGVFAIVANAAGTLPFEAFERLQVYIVIQAALCLILSFWLIPGLIAVLTPLKYKNIISAYRTPLLTAFATSNLLIVLPLIIDRSRELLLNMEVSEDKQALNIDSPLEVLVPVSFTFPSMGKLISLSFIPFASWYGGNAFPLSQYPAFLLTGLASMFGSGVTTIIFLLNLFGLPADMLQIYVTLDTISVARFGTLLAGMNTIGLALIATCAINGLVNIPKRKLIRFTLLSILSILLTLGGIHLFYTYGLSNKYTQDEKLEQLQLLRVQNPSSSVKILTTPPSVFSDSDDSEESRLTQIQERKAIRVCFEEKSYPLSYFNSQKPPELVGFNIEMAHILAQDLGVSLELLQMNQDLNEVKTNQIADFLKDGYCDIAMTSIPLTPQLAGIMDFSTSFQNYTLAFLVEDRDRDGFNNWQKLQSLSSLNIGFSNDFPYYKAKLKGLLPNANLIPIDSFEEYLSSKNLNIDTIVIPAEIGSAWTVLHPEYSIAIPRPIVSIPIAYALPSGEQSLVNVVNAWLQLKQQDNTIQSLYDYWIQGKTENLDPPRWSIIRNVLGWIK